MKLKIHRDLTIPQYCGNVSNLSLVPGARRTPLKGRSLMVLPEPSLDANAQRLIFVVEDDPDVSRLIEHNLRAAGYDVSTFFSGAPVLASAEALQTDWLYVSSCQPKCLRRL